MPAFIRKFLFILLPIFLTNLPIPAIAQEPPAKKERALQWITPEVTAPHLSYRIFDSPAAHTKISYHIYTPEIYETNQHQRFPVLYWLHGSGGGEKGLKPLTRYFDKAIREGKIPPMLIVFPNGLPNGMWCDSKNGETPIETIFIKELIPDVDATYRTIPSREGRIIEGFSMGGYGAARLGFNHHDLFAAISILGGGPLQSEFKITPRATPRARKWLYQTIYGDDPTYFQAQSPWLLAELHAESLRHNLTIRQIVGELDETLPANRELDAHLTKLQIPHTFTVLPGIEHNPPKLLKALGETNWKLFRNIFSNFSSSASRLN